jgi:hypothetical protein
LELNAVQSAALNAPRLLADAVGTFKVITGVVIEAYYENSTFKIDSFENIYIISIDNITKILNNTKFKYNLNKLNHIDFI